MAVAVVSDSTHYVPADGRGAARDPHRLAVRHWAGRTERESRMGGFGPFYDHLATTPTLPSTSQPSVGDFLEVYEPLLERGDDVLSIHLSGGISGTVALGRAGARRADRAGHRPRPHRGARLARRAAPGTASWPSPPRTPLPAAPGSRRPRPGRASCAPPCRSSSPWRRWSSCAGAGGSAARRPGSARRCGSSRSSRSTPRSCRSSACAPRRGPSSGSSTTSRRCATRAATASSSSTSGRPSRRSGWPRAGRSCSAARPRSCRRSGR